jgi:hypothetical protein
LRVNKSLKAKTSAMAGATMEKTPALMPGLFVQALT